MDPITIAMGLAQFAPAVIKWITGSDGAEQSTQKVIDIATQVTGAKTPEDALKAIQSSAQAQLDFRRAIMDHDMAMEKLAADDRASARTRDTEIRKTTGGHNIRADVMVISAVAGLVSCLIVLIFFRGDIPGEVVGIVSTVAGIFGSCLKDAYSFEFGSSRGSKEKDALLGEIARMP